MERASIQRDHKLDRILQLLQGDPEMKQKGIMELIQDHDETISYLKKAKGIIAIIITVAVSLVGFIEWVINRK